MNGRLVAVIGLCGVAVVAGLAVLAGRDTSSTGGSAAPAVVETAVPSTAAEADPSANPPPPTAAADRPVPAAVAEPAPTIAPPDDAPDLPDRGPHLELRDIDGWLQSDVTSLEELRGQVVAVQFWTFGCSNCKATLPHMQQLYADYHDAGFEIVGVHAPEFSYEAEVANIESAAADLGVTWPIVLDTGKRTFHDWQEGPTAYWPRIYLLDRDGHIRYDHIGEGRYDEIDAAVRALLAEPE